MKFLIAYFSDPNVMLLSSEIIEAQCLESAVRIFSENHPKAEILYIHNKKFEIWKNQ